MIKKNIQVKDARILLLGITFKENCPDVRNTRVVDILNTLKEYDTNITIFDPWADPAEVKHEYKWDATKELNNEADFDAIIMAVAHDEFKNLDIGNLCKANRVIYDVKGILPKEIVDGRL